jgi:hypothetical protein
MAAGENSDFRKVRGWRWALGGGLVLAMLPAPHAEGHKPLQIGGPASAHRMETAQRIPDPEISWVLYLDLPRPGQVDYFRFTGRGGAVVPIQLGVPKIPDLMNFRPVAVLIGPGLPPAPPMPAIDLPAGSGAVTIRFDAPLRKTFFEPFTRTTSWVTPEYRIPLPKSGEYFLAVYEPEGRTGKYFLGIGQKEAFSLLDFLRLPCTIWQVRRFYEP